jgi:hypothetical protein
MPEHTLDLINDNRQWQREARTLIESSRRHAGQRARRRPPAA